jgi:hypothetical protein
VQAKDESGFVKVAGNNGQWAISNGQKEFSKRTAQ